MRVLVTGSTGFLGRHVMNELLRKGVEIVSAVRNLPEQGEGAVVYRRFDLAAPEPGKNYFEYFEKPDVCIHLAWEGLPNYKDDFHLTSNLHRHILFLDSLLEHGLKSLTVTGTCLEYGLKEGELNEEMICEPIVPYAAAKLALLKHLMVKWSQKEVSLKWLRLFYMYGEGQNPKSLISQLEKALSEGQKDFPMSGGEQTRDFLPVERMAEMIVSLALKENWTGISNVCSGQPVTVKEFIEEYLRNSGRSIHLQLGVYPYPDYEPMAFWGSTKKLNQLLNNEPGRTV